MNTPDPAPAPNPYAVAGAQTNQNVSTALANTVLGNANEYTPWGNVEYAQSGNFTTITDPATGQTFQIPQYNRTVNLSESGKIINDQNIDLQHNLLKLARGQVGRLTDVLGQPIDVSSLPSAVNSVGSGPRFTGPAGTPTLQSRLPDAAGITRSIAGAGPIQNRLGLQSSINLAEAPTTFGRTAGNIQYGVGPQDGFSADRQRVEDALMGRLNPQLDQDREALRTRLVNQGLVEGTTAFNSAMDLANRQATDARLGAILAGGQEQSRLHDLALSQGQFNNTAQQQDFGQQQARGLFGMNAIDQNNAARLAAGNFGNAARAAEGEFVNAAQAQQFGQNQAGAQLANEAQAQQFGQGLAGGQFANTALQQDYQNRQGALDVQNQLAQRGYENTMTGANFTNTARERQLQEMLALRNQPINEISALMAGNQVQMPQFAQYRPGSVGGTDLAGAIYDSAALDQQSYAQQMAQQNAMMGGLFGLGSAGMYGLAGGLRKSRLVA